MALRVLACGMALAGIVTVGADAAPVQDTGSGMTVQQAFEHATKLTDSGKDAEALAAWERLEQRVGNNPRSVAVVRLRKSDSLVALHRSDEALADLRAALDALPDDDPSLAEDRRRGFVMMGVIEEGRLDYAGALDAYRAALDLSSTSAERMAALRGMIATGTYIAPNEMAPRAKEAEALLKADDAFDGKARATVEMAISELYLNLGQFERAGDHAKEAVSELGGLTPRTDIDDVAARSDFAIAALKEGKDQLARKYLAYTVQSNELGLDSASQIVPPDCGGPEGFRPDDVAVVEFFVGADGSVPYARPVYANRQGVGLPFARAVRQWSWSAEQVAEMPAFFRARARVELRCATVAERPDVWNFLDGALTDWIADQGVATVPADDPSDARRLAADRRRLAATDPQNALARLPILFDMMTNRVTPYGERAALAEEALETAKAHDAPPLPRLAIALQLWQRGEDYRQALEQALQDPFYSADGQARAALDLIAAEEAGRKDQEAALAYLSDAASGSGLADKDPLRIGALVRTASIRADRGDTAAARAAFEKTGLAADQCAMLDAPPTSDSSVGSNAFPREARRWGFEGWVRLQYDVTADGHTDRVRAVASYPPFVFTEASEDVFRGLHYTKTYRPDGGAGCGGMMKGIHYRID
ncbi:energy transducer TonB [Stakelama saccharophila]|uniref:Energy transducer TonB n=1 Tax=Stakelama saccharophila TaxID=3075605 RepID=A0ABZ0B6D5_9SPHN|nr:energy transducer TonB [Stakelama sp. W311]WNO52767.1 energy transducer TonB [Stakelama sp. W311]